MRLIDADMICKYCDNNINHSITPNEIMRMPFIDAEPVKHGKWSKQCLQQDVFGDYRVGFICSACKNFVPIKGKYCAECGAKMDLKDGENNE